MRPGPPVQPSRRRPPRRQHPHQQQLHREHNRQQQQQQQQERRRSRLLPRPRGHGSHALLVLLLLASNPLVLAQAEPPESPVALAAPTTQCQQPSTHRNLWSASNDTAAQPRNLTIGYLTAIKGGLKDRQGLAISGALTMALDEVRFTAFRALSCEFQPLWKKKRGKVDWTRGTNPVADIYNRYIMTEKRKSVISSCLH